MDPVQPAEPNVITGVEENWTTVSGARMRFLHSGTGTPFLLIHGLLGYSFSWRYTIPALAPLRRVFAPDMLGTGLSERPADLDCSLTACASRMLEFMDRVDAPTFDLLGTSHGGGVAVRMAAIAPHRVTKLILVDPVNPWSPHGR